MDETPFYLIFNNLKKWHGYVIPANFHLTGKCCNMMKGLDERMEGVPKNVNSGEKYVKLLRD